MLSPSLESLWRSQSVDDNIFFQRPCLKAAKGRKGQRPIFFPNFSKMRLLQIVMNCKRKESVQTMVKMRRWWCILWWGDEGWWKSSMFNKFNVQSMFTIQCSTIFSQTQFLPLSLSLPFATVVLSAPLLICNWRAREAGRVSARARGVGCWGNFCMADQPRGYAKVRGLQWAGVPTLMRLK